MFTDLGIGTILDIVDGHRRPAVRRWLAERPRWWRARATLVARHMFAEFRAAMRTALPKAVMAADHFHVVARAKQMTTSAAMPAQSVPAQAAWP